MSGDRMTDNQMTSGNDKSTSQDRSTEKRVFKPRKLNTQSNSNRQKVAALGVIGLLVLTLGVFIVLPKTMNTLPLHQNSADDTAKANRRNPLDLVDADGINPSHPLPQDGDSPRTLKKTSELPQDNTWESAQITENRRNAQDNLNDLLRIDAELKSMEVETWAKAAYTEGKKVAEKADLAYENMDFKEAAALYNKALIAFKNIQASSTNTAKKADARAEEYIHQRKPESAEHHASIAVAIDQKNAEYERRLLTARHLKAALPYLIEAETLEINDNIKDAILAAQKALDIDPSIELSQSTFKRLEEKQRKQQIASIISRALRQANDNRFTAALKTLNEAKKIAPRDVQLDQIFNQISSSQKDFSISKNSEIARRAEIDEDWESASLHYQTILKSYPELVEYQKKLQTSTRRKVLYSELRSIIENPDDITKSEQRLENTRLLLATARDQSSASTPKLNQKIDELSTILVLANTPKPVYITSDNKTDIVIYRVGKLGAINNQTLALNPGSYTFLGTRQGYRDVRLDITIGINDSQKEVTLICHEKVSSS